MKIISGIRRSVIATQKTIDDKTKAPPDLGGADDDVLLSVAIIAVVFITSNSDCFT